MRSRFSMGWTTLALGVAFAIPTLAISWNASAKSSGTTVKGDQSASGDEPLSKEDQAKLKEHNKLRNEIVHVKYPANKAEVVAHVKNIKADDKKWFEETLPERTYSSADEVMSALGWETAAANDEKPVAHPKPAKTSMNGKGEKAPK